MSAQVIVLADHRSSRPVAEMGPASPASPDLRLAIAAHDDDVADPYGLVAAVRALAANMETMKTQSTQMRETYRSLSEGAQAIAAETKTIASAVERLGELRASAIHV